MIHAASNITGGGITGNIIRAIPEQHTANIDLSKIRITEIFKWIKSKNVTDNEMIKTFNCGVGFCLIVEKQKVNKVKKFFEKKFQPYEVGFVSKSSKKIKLLNKLKW